MVCPLGELYAYKETELALSALLIYLLVYGLDDAD